MKTTLLLLALIFSTLTGRTADTATPVPDAVRSRFALAPFYEKTIALGEFPIVGSKRVSDAALMECAWIVRHMLTHRPELLKALADANVRFAVMAYNEFTTDIPEHAKLTPAVYWDRRARGLGASPESPAVSAAEENLLSFPGDPYPTEIIAIHEFAHAIHELGMARLDPTFDQRLKAAYADAMQRGLWKKTYAATDRMEYWAEATQSWFDNNRANDSLHNDVDTRDKLKAYDPGVAALCAEVYGDLPWRYQKPAARSPEDRAHLAGLDREKAPRFQWRTAEVPARPRVLFQCAGGDLEIEIDGSISREMVGALLDHIHRGFYSDGRARFTENTVELTPAGRTPNGDAVPPREGRWTLFLGEAPPDKIHVILTDKDGVLPKLRAAKEAWTVQRMVRLN
jgi:hypothetical protein